MDVTHFLNKRTDFIQFYYAEGVKPFIAIQTAIQNEDPPFDNPPFDDSGEPAFLVEWMDAELGRELVGLQCISLLSESMKIYFNTLRDRVIRPNALGKMLFNKGFLKPYKEALAQHLKIDWSLIAIDFDIIEQIVLARDQASHAEMLSMIQPSHYKSTLKKFPKPFFMDGNGVHPFLGVKVSVSKAKLDQAVEEVTKMANVIDAKVFQRGP